MNSDASFNLSNVCRLCLRSCKDLRDIFADEWRSMNLSSKIMACVSLKIVPNDRGPRTICDKCFESINNWYEFNQVCQVSNALLTKYLNEALDFNRRSENLVLDKSSLLNESLSLPEISILSHDSLLDRNFGADSGVVSPIHDFCINSNFSFCVSLEETTPRRTSTAATEAVVSTTFGNLPASGFVDCQKSSKSPTKRGYECEFCNCTFQRFSSLLKHDSKEHVVLQKHCCLVCSRLFVSADRMKMHADLMHREKSFRCPTCGKLFSSRKSLSVHQRLHSEQYKCEICGFVSTAKLYLTQHIRKHEGTCESFVCSMCDKSFSHKSSLLRHENLHLANKGRSFRCSVCHLSLRTSSELIDHKNTHQTTTSNRRHVCNKCDKSFKSRKILNMHVQRHEPAQLSCEICHKKLFSRYELRVHSETHSDCKMYSCFHCSKQFSFKNTLIRHLKKHYSRVRSDIEV